MIYVTQGHEKSISIEVFLKSCLHLSNIDLEKIIFICKKSSLLKNLNDLNFKYIIEGNELNIYSKKIICSFIDDSEFQSTACLEKSLLEIKENDILLTLPTSKDQLVLNGTIEKGHTEYFRTKFNNNSISMNFISDSDKIILVSDHIPLKDVPTTIKQKEIFEKIEYFINKFPDESNYFISGINPHAGEGGLLGNEESLIIKSIQKLSEKLTNKNFYGPIPGDSIYRHSNEGVLVFMYHDQALSYFKSKNLLRAINLSLGLPFIRVSPDHGTAFNLYGKNTANYSGCLYCLNWSLRYLSKRF